MPLDAVDADPVIDEDVVQIATAPTHRDFDISLRQPNDQACTRVLAALIHIHDLGLAIFDESLL